MVSVHGILAVTAAMLIVPTLGCSPGGAKQGAAAISGPRPAATPSSTASSSPDPVDVATPAPAAPPAQSTKPSATPVPARARAAPPPAAAGAAGPVAWGLWEPNWQGHGDSVDFGQYARVESELGHGTGIVHWFANWDEGWDYDGLLVSQVLRTNRTPMITWEAYNRPLKAIAGGQYDGYIDSWARGMAASQQRPIYLRIFHEFNDPLEPGTGSGYPWGTGGGTQNQPADLVAAWRHIHDRFAAAGASNVRFVWCPDGVNLDLGRLRAAYPGDSYVDFAGWDAYDYDTAHDYAVLSQVSQKPFVVSETGSRDAGWVQDLSGKLRSGGYGRIRAVVWFDQDSWRLDANPGVRAAVKSMLTTFA